MAQTLPREIIKWIQGLDLSYSVRDIKKDLSNGFLVAEIVSRYRPGIQMHSFDNSQRQERRQNNWSLLEKLFQKQGINLGREDFAKIVSSSDVPTIIEFMVRLYEELTDKKLNRNPLVVIQNFNKTLGATGKQEDFNQSFLLKDKGLEKFPEDRQAKDLEERKLGDREEHKPKDDKDHKEPNKPAPHYDMSKSSQITTSSKLKTFLKYESRLISPRPELSTLKFEVKSTNIRPLNINVSKLRATKENNMTMGGTSNYTHMSMEMGAGNVERAPPSPQGAQALLATEKSQSSKKEKQKEQTIYDILGEFMDLRFSNSSFAKEYTQFNLKSYPESIANFNDYFNAMVFKEVLDRIDFITSFVLKDLNETWKLVNFMLNCLKSVLIDKEYFRTIIEILRHLGERTVNKDPHRSIKLLKENFLEIIYQQMVTAPIFEKKEHIAMLMYYFIPNTPDAKKQVILAFKDVAKDQKIFMEALVILVSSEKNNRPGEDVSFYFEIGMKYAKAGIQSSHPVVKTMSLALIANLARLNYELIFEFIRSRLDDLSLEEGWEDKCQVIIICSKIVNGLINTDNYQNLVKKNTLNYTKNYSWQNEMIANKLKEDIKTFGDAIIKILQSKPNNYVVRVFIVYCVDICHEVKGIMDQIVAILVQSERQFRNWFFNNKEIPREEFFVYNDKSLRYRTGFNSEELKKSSKEFLMSLTENVRENRPERLEASHLEILEFGLSHTDFKVLNVELLLGITNLFIPYIFNALCEEDLLEIATKVLRIFLTYRIEQDLRIKDLEKLFGDTLVYLYRSENETCLNNMKDIIGWYREEIDARKLFRENELFKDILQHALGQDAEKQYLDELQKFMESIISSLEMEREPEK